MPLATAFSRASFDLVHRNHLVYNTCWEDPRLDREALGLGGTDTVMAITSAGCNVLDYALDGPARIHAVDLNPRQNALLELKMAGIRALSHEDFFALFGRGRHEGWQDLYPTHLRPQLSDWATRFWDAHGHIFSGRTRRRSFYFHGSSGLVAWALRGYFRWVGVQDDIRALLETQSLDAQRAVYERVRGRILGPGLRWLLGRDALMALLAVPEPQRAHLERHFPGGIAQFIVARLDEVFTQLPLSDNYFWRVYLQGHYDTFCCPEYLRPEPFAALKAGLVDRITVHTASVESCLRTLTTPVTALVLLDHMDWLCSTRLDALRAEWQAIVDVAAPHARVIWRSGGPHTDFLSSVPVARHNTRHQLGDLLTCFPDVTAPLHARDRVRTYGSFHLAHLTC